MRPAALRIAVPGNRTASIGRSVGPPVRFWLAPAQAAGTENAVIAFLLGHRRGMPARDLLLLLTGAASALGLFTAVLALSDRRLARPVRAWLLGLGLGVCAFGLGRPELQLPWPPAARTALLMLAAPSPWWLWLLAGRVFEDEAPPSSWVLGIGAVFAAVPLIVRLSPPALAVFWAMGLSLVASGLALHLLWRLLHGRQLDLDPARRRMRGVIAGVGGPSLLVALWVRVHGPAWDDGLLAAMMVANQLVWLRVSAAASPTLLQALAERRPADSAPSPAPSPVPPASISAATVAASGALPSIQSNAVRLAPELVRLQAAMDEEHLYHQPGLSIGALAAHLGLPEYRTRQLINGELGYRNFNVFLNGYRLREAAARLRDPSQMKLPITTIALDVGFASLGPFQRAFREAYGCTPSEWRQGDARHAES